MSDSGLTRAEALANAIKAFREAGLHDPARDARVLLRWASGLEAAALTARMDDMMGEAERDRFLSASSERLGRRPVAQIIGERAFWGRSFEVTPDVLDPRPETEILIAAALEGGVAARVLDLGVGSGCILLTLLAEWPKATGVGVDVSAAALAVAARNAERLGVAARAELRQGDWLEDVSGEFDLVVSNPPYISEVEMRDLDVSVRRFEPHVALTPGGDGLDAYRRIAAGARARLAPGGRMLLEVGAGQADAVEAIFVMAGFSAAGRHRDFDGRERCVSLRRNHG